LARSWQPQSTNFCLPKCSHTLIGIIWKNQLANENFTLTLNGYVFKKRWQSNLSQNRELYYVFVNESKSEVKQSKYAELRKQTAIKNIRKFEQDLYEYKMRIGHVADEDDTYYLMRMINTRISVIEDFLYHERLSEAEHKRWWGLLEKYYSLREELANVTTYRYDYSDSLIVVKYPETVGIQSDSALHTAKLKLPDSEKS